MPFIRPTLKEIKDRIEADVVAKIRENKPDFAGFLRRSLTKFKIAAYAAAVYLLYDFLSFMKDQLFLTSADEVNLDMNAGEYGVLRKAAQKATGSGLATGTNGKTITQGSRLQFDQLIYLVDSDVTISGGTATVDFTSELPGAEYNQDPGISLTFVNPITGVDTTVTVDSNGIENGTNQELDDPYRARALARKRLPPHGGIKNDYEQWVLEVSGNTRAWIFPQYMGRGTVGVAFTRDNDIDIIPSAEQMEDTREYIISHLDPITGTEVGAPVTAEPGIIMIQLQLQAVNFDIKLDPNTAVVQAAVETRLEQLLFDFGGPGEGLAYSQMSEAISAAQGEIKNKLLEPSDDVGVGTNRVATLGTLNFQDY